MTKQQRHDRDIFRISCLNYLGAAENLSCAYIHRMYAIRNNLHYHPKGSKSKELSNCNEDEEIRSPEMGSIDEHTNLSIEYFKNFNTYIEGLPAKKRLIKAFSNWYCNSWDAFMIKEYTLSILLISKKYSEYKNGIISQEIFYRFMDEMKSYECGIYLFSRSRALMCFLALGEKINEIEEKILERQQRNCQTDSHNKAISK